MPWLKTSDKFAQHPFVLALRRSPGADERSVNEVTGFVHRCATSSAGYMTDYFITIDVAELYGGARTTVLLRQAVAAGLLAVEGSGRARRWRIVEDDDLFHIRAREDVEWERQRDRDRRNPELTMPVLARDGDVCRYCSVVCTSAKDTRSGRGRTFDHTEPGRPASIETYVVCCYRCNGRLRNHPRPHPDVPLRPAPALPYFSAETTTRAEVEAFYGHPIAAANDQRGPAATGAASPSREPADATPGPAGAATGAPASGAPPPTTVVPPRSGSGRRDGTGRGGTGAPPSLPDAPSRPRGSRGRRGGAAR